MSEGELCGHKIKLSRDINGENTIELSCDLYSGHEGEHSKMFYHCTDRPNDKIFKTNHRIGRINWKSNYQEE